MLLNKALYYLLIIACLLVCYASLVASVKASGLKYRTLTIGREILESEICPFNVYYLFTLENGENDGCEDLEVKISHPALPPASFEFEEIFVTDEEFLNLKKRMDSSGNNNNNNNVRRLTEEAQEMKKMENRKQRRRDNKKKKS